MIFGYTENQLKALRAADTAAEIRQQPVTWQKTIAQIKDIWEDLQANIRDKPCP